MHMRRCFFDSLPNFLLDICQCVCRKSVKDMKAITRKCVLCQFTPTTWLASAVAAFTWKRLRLQSRSRGRVIVQQQQEKGLCRRQRFGNWSGALPLHLQFSSMLLPLLLITVLSSPSSVTSCYLFSDMPDPCADKACLFGSRCVPSSDGLYATCEWSLFFLIVYRQIMIYTCRRLDRFH